MILSANPILTRNLPRPKEPVARAGLSYQRKFTEKLRNSLPESLSLDPNPWFEYRDSDLPAEIKTCCPDLTLMDTENGFFLVIEIKQTWTPLAIEKLRTLYCPVVAKAFGIPARPLVVAKKLIPGAPRPQPTITFALIADDPLVHWTGTGPILW